MGKLRIAIAGAGYFARFHYDAWSRMPAAELVGCCDPQIEKAAAVAAEFGVPRSYADAAAMLADTRPDIVDIATPPATHAALVRLAADHARTIICQKAFCTTLEEARQTVDHCASRDVTLVVHENFRFQPWHRALRAQIEAGVLGEIYQVTFRLRPGDGQGPDAYLGRQPYFQKMPRFLMRETGIHFIDTFRYLLGEVTGLQASLTRLNPVIAGEDAAIVVFEFASGARALFDANRLSDHIAQDRRRTMGDMWIEGSRGTLRLDGEGRIYLRAFGSNDEQHIDGPWPNAGFAGDSVRALQQHVVDHIQTGQPLENSGSDYLRNLEIEAAIYHSHAIRSHVGLQSG